MTDQRPEEPSRPELDPDDPKTVLQRRVRSALLALPGDFSFDNPIAGVNATDLFNLNTLLGAGIEVEVVRTLNSLRDMWDPDNEWLGYRFERSSQAFPDVRLVRRDEGDPDVALGIELKGWWLLSKEGVPSLRYQVAPAACAPHDLICVVPWHLSNAVAGVAQVTEPWVESARYAAEYRDYWWQHVRRTSDADTSVHYPEHARPYPRKAELVLATPAYDGGGNYGRLPRSKPLMDDFIERSKQHEVLGIPVADWILFLRRHSDTATPEDVEDALQAELQRHLKNVTPDTAAELLALLEKVGSLLRP
ncbi:hypothetical protein QKF57_13920 [Clavibacter michiganensis]|uniref:hypothetical protein n=1 Tax=Clavibacter michiganensis TaxID=28447 RepID=UPI0026DD63FE|nr:hypothetical protein [Clavibacter michiganensis]MDO4027094.1 hypothetical protein [Clavibacter michiganensis]MDO4036487.1 hypothetical protein [Clavibacter michiganensis]MDO4048684.1 hypothetical protein [Clavibacter michiganensis]MDO4058025.1 hypothetical protein [Clavibacter michiganensis]MDO4061060.1 hypothetical protein [Clavibacter michiganensis]